MLWNLVLSVRLSDIDFVIIFHVHPDLSIGVDFFNGVNLVWVSVGPLRPSILALFQLRAIIKIP